MAEGKKRIVVYADWLDKFESLTDEEAGKLIKHFFRYVNDQNPVAPDRITELAFIDIKLTLKRDLKKWEGFIEKQSENGKKGGRPKNPEEPIETQKTQAFLNKPKKAVSDSVTDNDSVIVVYNAEVEILGSPIRFEQICMATKRSLIQGKESLRKFHLHLESKEEYPKSKKSLFAGFEKWLLNEKTFEAKVKPIFEPRSTGTPLKDQYDNRI